MAVDTPQSYRNLVIYEIYVRNHTPEGTFASVTADLERIAGMGVDVVWLMPIHPPGRERKKGSLGSPYAIADYRAVNPAYGTEGDFDALVARAHELGLRVMIDVVFNHTAPDNPLLREQPGWYHRDAAGRPVTTVPEWSDIVDLVYDDPALWDYQIETLKQWVRRGVDGFRCDVASLLPIEFWQTARQEVAEVRADVIWLAESVHTSFVRARRHAGLLAHSDSELYSAFDITYNYDIWPVWEAAVADPTRAGRYLDLVRFQDGIYPANYVKLRYVENHDQPRIMARTTRNPALAWTAFAAFNKGAFLIYAGQESAATHTPSLFDRDPVRWEAYDLQPFLAQLAALKKDPAQREGRLSLLAGRPAIAAMWQAAQGGLYGVFNVAGSSGPMDTPLPDGEYEDALSGLTVRVRGGALSLPDSAIILRYEGTISDQPLATFIW